MRIDPQGIQSSIVPQPHSGANRIPILLLGALLHRFREVSVPLLGGCRIGARRVDFHLQALKKFGAVVKETEEGFTAEAPQGLKGTQIRLPYPSVGATETCLFLSVLAKGRTLISNAAIEPEIEDLMTMLQSMGAIIFRSAGRDIRVEGVPKLHGTRMHILGDRIEAASWASLACATDGEIIVRGVRPEILSTFLSYFQQIGGGVMWVPGTMMLAVAVLVTAYFWAEYEGFRGRQMNLIRELEERPSGSAAEHTTEGLRNA